MNLRRSLKRFAAAAAWWVLVLAGSPALSQPVPPDAEIVQMLSARVDVQKRGTGVVVGIARPEGNRIIAYGTRGLADKTPVDGNTVYDLGSVTKVFTGLLLADMAQRREVALGDPAQEYFPPGQVKLPTYEGSVMTLADLATHTSGLPFRPNNLASKDPHNQYAGYTLDDLYAFLSACKLNRAPGSRYEYSNVGFALLGLALSRRANMDYEDLLRSRITAPLGMQDTQILPTGGMQRREALPYDYNLKPTEHSDMVGAMESAGALRSTANDLLKLLDAFLGLRRSQLLPAMNAMTMIRRPGGMKPATAIVIAWNIYDDGAREIVWKNGNVDGYRAFIGYDAKARLGVVALANAQTAEGVDDIGLHLLDPAIRVDLRVPRPPASPKPSRRSIPSARVRTRS
jgi:CubicO group peptidase (beta-lactamase class C family)